MTLRWVTLDVFTDQRYYGNPLAIIHVPTSTTLSQGQKQLIAREFNLSESVFLHQQTEEDQKTGDVRIDIFTPIAEVPFAGHPTVGTSNYLLRYLPQSLSTFSEWKDANIQALQAKAGRIPIQLSTDGDGITLSVAHNVHIHNNPFADTPHAHFPVVSIVKGMTFILAKLDSLADLSKVSENLLGTQNTYKAYTALDEGWQEGLVNTHFYVDLGRDEHGTRQIRTRGLGSREDPATGSAASALTSYLTLSEAAAGAEAEAAARNDDELQPFVRKYALTQGVEMGRKSNIYIEITLQEDRKTVKQVLLTGSAVKVMEGTLEIPH